MVANYGRSAWLGAETVRKATAGFAAASEGVPPQTLVLEGSVVDATALRELPHAFPDLTELDLSRVRGVESAALAAALADLPHLRAVSLDRSDPRRISTGPSGSFRAAGPAGAAAGLALSLAHAEAVSVKHAPHTLSDASLLPVLEAALEGPSAAALEAALGATGPGGGGVGDEGKGWFDQGDDDGDSSSDDGRNDGDSAREVEWHEDIAASPVGQRLGSGPRSVRESGGQSTPLAPLSTGAPARSRSGHNAVARAGEEFSPAASSRSATSEAKAGQLIAATGGVLAAAQQVRRQLSAAAGLAPLAWELLDATGTASSLDAAMRPPLAVDGTGCGAVEGGWDAPHCAEAGLTDAGLAVLGACAPRLRAVSLRHCVGSTSRCACAAGAASACAAGASVAGSVHGGEAAAGARAEALPLLPGTVSDGGLAALVGGLCGPRLTSLDLAGCSWLTDAGLAAVGAHCASLRAINLAACVRVTDSGLASLVQPTGCVTLLEAMAVTRCAEVTGAGVRKVLTACQGMRSAVLTRSGVSREDLASLAMSFAAVGFLVRDPTSYVDASASQLVLGFKRPPPGESMDDRVRAIMANKVAAAKSKKKGGKSKKAGRR